MASIAEKIAVGAVAGLLVERVVQLGRRDSGHVEPPDPDGLDVTATDGSPIHVRTWGDPAGRPVVLLHGVTMHAGMWQRVADGLSDHHILAMDLRGHGGSRAGEDGLGLEANAGDLATVLETLDLREVVLLGHSMGGMVVTRFLADAPADVRARVAGVGLVSTVGRAPLPWLSRPAAAVTGFLAPFAARHRRLAWGLTRLPGSGVERVVTRATFGSDAVDVDVDAVVDAYLGVHPADIAVIAPSLLGHDVLDDLADVRCPVVVLVGENDLVTRPTDAQRLADAFPDAEFRVEAGAGHQLFLERAEAVVDVVRTLDARA
ncbi:MAG: alpha/beta fold hydrolase [Acidimicrobiales bacterium]